MSRRTEEDAIIGFVVKGIAVAIALVIGVAALGMWGCPKYKVYEQRLSGEAKLREAEWSRKIEIEAAKAKLESAKLHKESEIVRAEGVSQANSIISDGLGGPEGYLRYLWIQGLQDGSSEVIYVPTEAGLPILEAGKQAVKAEVSEP